MRAAGRHLYAQQCQITLVVETKYTRHRIDAWLDVEGSDFGTVGATQYVKIRQDLILMKKEAAAGRQRLALFVKGGYGHNRGFYAAN